MNRNKYFEATLQVEIVVRLSVRNGMGENENFTAAIYFSLTALVYIHVIIVTNLILKVVTCPHILSRHLCILGQ